MRFSPSWGAFFTKTPATLPPVSELPCPREAVPVCNMSFLSKSLHFLFADYSLLCVFLWQKGLAHTRPREKNMKIAFYDTKEYDRASFHPYEDDALEFRYLEERLSEETADLAAGCEGVCVFVNDTVSAKVIDQLHASGVRFILLRCAGYNNVNLEHCRKLKMPVFRVPAYSPYAVAEHTMAMLLTSIRRIHKAYNRTREFNFSLSGLTGFDLHGKTAGVIGTGKIGRAFINICRGFGMNVLAYDKFPSPEIETAPHVLKADGALSAARALKADGALSAERALSAEPALKEAHALSAESALSAGYAEKAGERSGCGCMDCGSVRYVPLGELFEKSDIISLHCPLTDETHHIIDAAAITAMKKGVVIVNTSRGALIDAESLLSGIKDRKIGAVCLDVYEEEAGLFFNDFSGHIISDDVIARLISMPNVLVTSHQAFLTKEALSAIAETTVDNIYDYVEKGGGENEVAA